MLDMTKVLEQDNDAWQTLAAATARALERTEKQEVDRDGDTNTGRGDEKDCGSDGSDIDQRRAAAG
jgi:hypothetical protein